MAPAEHPMDAVVFDCDGTLVDVTGLRKYVEGLDKDYDLFHRESAYAPAIPWVVEEARRWYLSQPMPEVIVVTARQEKYREITEQWLQDNGVWYHQLMMRTNKDYRSDYIVKQEILQDIIDLGYTVVHAYDDNPSTYKLWIESGIATTIVPGWNYDREVSSVG